MMQAWADYLDELRVTAQHERTVRETSTSRPNISSELNPMIGYPITPRIEDVRISSGLCNNA